MRKILILSFLSIAAACGNEDNVKATNSMSSEQALGDSWGNKKPAGQEVRSDDKLSSKAKGKHRETFFVDNGEVVQLEHKQITSESGESETAPSESAESGGGGSSEETPEPLEPEACDPVGCALMNNACFIFYCSGTNPWCFSAYRDDDWDGAASCPGELYGEYGSTFYPGAYDCNDYNAAVRPGNNEVCADALDNDCDGQVDSEDNECTGSETDPSCYTDADCNHLNGTCLTYFCSAGECLAQSNDWDGDGWNCDVDCDEGNAFVNPGAVEACGNVVDENCDGETCVSIPTMAGTYECEVSPDTPRANIILADGKTNVLTVRCKAHGEDVRLDTFHVDILGNFAAVVQVNLSVEDGTSWTAAHTDGTVQFGYVGHFLDKEVWTKFYVGIELLPLLPTYPTSSGDTVQLELGPNKGIGQTSGVAIYFTPHDPTPMGNEMVIRKTKPTITLAYGSPSGYGIPGMSEVLRLNACADSRGDVYLDQVVFQLESTDIGSTTWNDCDSTQLGSATKWGLYDADDPATKLDADTAWTFLRGNGTACVSGQDLKYAILQLDSLYVSAGTCRTLMLRVDSIGANTSNDNILRVDIPLEISTDTFDSINWCDDDLACGINGEFIRNLPLIGGTIVF